MKPWHILTVILLLFFGGGMMSAQTGYDPPLPAEPQGETPFNPDLPSEPQGDDMGNDPFNPDLPSEPQGDEPGDEPFNPDLPSEPQGSVFFTVTFTGFDNALLGTQRVEQGQSATAPDAPDVEGYTFTGWDKDFANVQSDLTVTAVYEKDVVYFTVTWRNDDGTLLFEEDVQEGIVPVYTGDVPAKPADAQYTYTFVGWTPEVVTVTGSATYTATYTSTVRQYTVTFKNEDGTTIDSRKWDYGTMPTCEEPTKPEDERYTYTFAGWDKDVVTVTGDATYTATYEAVLKECTIETTDGATIWEDELPYTWESVTFNEAGTETLTLQASDGCDSVVTFTLRVRHHNIVLQENEDAQYYDLFAEDYNGKTVTSATLNRQFIQGKWSTLCLPFNVNKGQMTALGLLNRVYEFRYMETLDDATKQIYFSVAQSIEAGKGYIVNANAKLAAKTSFVFTNVTICTDADNEDITTLTGYNDGTGRGGIYLVGTLRTGLLQGSADGNTYLGLKDNKLYYPNTATGTAIRAYRGFFRSETPVNAQRIRIVAEGEPVTELEVMNGDADMQDIQPARKFINNGILYIRCNGKTYTAQGAEL